MSGGLAEIRPVRESVYRQQISLALRYVLGVEVQQDKGVVFSSQTSYTEKLLERFGMSESKPAKTPSDHKIVLTKDMSPETNSCEQMEMREHDYRGLVGALLYLSCVTRPDISFIVSRLSMFLDNPCQNHWISGKRVLRYLKGTLRVGLSFKVCSELSLTGFSNADYAADTDTRRSTTGYFSNWGRQLFVGLRSDKPVLHYPRLKRSTWHCQRLLKRRYG